MPLGVILLLCSLWRTKVFSFPLVYGLFSLRIFAIYTLAGMDFISWSDLKLDLMGLVTATMLVLLLHQHTMQEGYLVDWKEGFVPVLAFTFFLHLSAENL